MALVLFVAFLVVPILELYVIVQVGHVLGLPLTLGLLLGISIIGAALVKREGSRAWQALRTALGTGRMPTRELADGALVLVGGTLLLAPGFLTDLVGALLVIPPTRAVARRLLPGLVLRRAMRGSRRGASRRVVEGTVLRGGRPRR